MTKPDTPEAKPADKRAAHRAQLREAHETLRAIRSGEVDALVVTGAHGDQVQLFRNASGWGIDFEQMEKDGRLLVHSVYPETAGLEDHPIRMKALMDDFRPNRVAVDSLSALERVSSTKGYREFVIGLTSFIKQDEITGLFTATTPTLLGGTSITEAHISTIADSIILLRYVEMDGEMRRGMTVLKMRGSMHDKQIREFSIDSRGLHVGKAFRNVAGILTGNPHQVSFNEIERTTAPFEKREDEGK